jgi:hypothetical protein
VCHSMKGTALIGIWRLVRYIIDGSVPALGNPGLQ